MFSPARPPLAWSIVASALAANTGCTIGTCTVANSAICSVTPASAAASVNVSNDHSREFVTPPKPRHRAIGRKNSSPARSAICATATTSGHSARHRSGTRVSVSPPSALAEKTPSFNRLGPRIGMRTVGHGRCSGLGLACGKLVEI